MFAFDESLLRFPVEVEVISRRLLPAHATDALLCELLAPTASLHDLCEVVKAAGPPAGACDVVGVPIA